MSSNSNDAWECCESGEVASVVTSLRAQTVARQARRRTQITLMVALLGFVGIFGIITAMSRGAVVQMACADVSRLAEQYLDASLDDDTIRSIEAHLAYCIRCREHVQETRRSREASGDLPRSGEWSPKDANLVSQL